MDKITVDKSGLIKDVNRYTEIPFAALDLAEFNMMFPDEAVEGEFDGPIQRWVLQRDYPLEPHCG